MTLSSDRGTELSIDNLILTAYQQAGIMSMHEGFTSPQWSDRVTFARRRLDSIIDELPTVGGFARSVEFYNLTLAEGTYKYSLPSYTLNIESSGMYIDASETDITKAESETVVKQISRETWHSLASKASEGTPNLMYCHRATSPPQLWLWPIPDEAGTVRVQIYRLSTDNYEGDKTIDLQRYWNEYITYRLAYALALASNMPMDHSRTLRDEAKTLLARARAYSNDHTGNQIHVCHGRRM